MTESKVMEGRICDPDVMLILTSPERTVELSDFVAQRKWIRGYGQGASFRTAMEYLKNEDVIGWRAFWLGLLLHCFICDGASELSDFIVRHIPQDWGSSLKGADVNCWYSLIRRNLEEANSVLDELDEHLTITDQWVFIAYDGLEAFDAAGSYMPIRALIGFWFDRLRRWQRLRAKIFLRSDLFSIGRLNFPDASKLFGHLVRLDEC